MKSDMRFYDNEDHLLLPDNLLKYIPAGAVYSGNVISCRVQIEGCNAWKMKQRYVSLALEPNVLLSQADMLIKLGAVRFENRQPVERFSAVIEPEIWNLSSMTKLQGFVSDVVNESDAFAGLAYFLRDVLKGETILCVHQADLVIPYLSAALSRNGWNAYLRLVDTLKLSQSFIEGLPDYCLNTVADHVGITHQSESAAVENAEICGGIMCNLIGLLP